MKRLNPETGSPFRRGDVREDGKVFAQYKLHALKSDGFFGEQWYSPEAYALISERRVTIFRENYRKNKAKIIAVKKEYRAKNSERVLARRERHYLENKERLLEQKRIYRVGNKGKINAKNKQRKLAKIERTPEWLDSIDKAEIEFTYVWCAALRSCGLDYHVDHIVPLQGKTVSGLHVPWNLQVLPAAENIRKKNRWDRA